ncbi:hypothetical protein H4R35_002218 [Dimargaris xerosporica]|nr:hypothetical protein H4R35_002218 [Dimargaris xerosporica]
MKITYSYLLLSMVLWHQHSATASLHLGPKASLVRRSMQATAESGSGDPSCTTPGCPGMNIEIPDTTMEAQFASDGAGPDAPTSPQSFSPDALLDEIQAKTGGDPASLTDQQGTNGPDNAQPQPTEFGEDEDCEEDDTSSPAALDEECEDEVDTPPPAALDGEKYEDEPAPPPAALDQSIEPTPPPAAFDQGSGPPANLAPAPPAATVTVTVTETTTTTVTDCAPSNFAPEPTPMADEQNLALQPIPPPMASENSAPLDDPECADDPAAMNSFDNEGYGEWVCEGDEGFDPALVTYDPECDQPDPMAFDQQEPPVTPEIMPQPPQPDPASLDQSGPPPPAAMDSEPCDCDKDQTPAPAAAQEEMISAEPVPAAIQPPEDDCDEDVSPNAEQQFTPPEPIDPAVPNQDLDEECEEESQSPEVPMPAPAALLEEVSSEAPAPTTVPVEDPVPAAIQEEVPPAETTSAIDQQLMPSEPAAEPVQEVVDTGEKCEDDDQPAAVQEEVSSEAPVAPPPADVQESSTVEPTTSATEVPMPDAINQDLDGDGTITVTSTTCTDTSSTAEAALVTVTDYECNECQEAALQESSASEEPVTTSSAEENQASLSSEPPTTPTAEDGSPFTFFDKVKDFLGGSPQDAAPTLEGIGYGDSAPTDAAAAEPSGSPTYLNRRAWSHRKHHQTG